MTNPTPKPPVPHVAVPEPMNMQIGNGQAPDGSPIVFVILTQSQLTAQFVMNPGDAANLAKAIADASATARSGLILPPGAVARLNGHQS